MNDTQSLQVRSERIILTCCLRENRLIDKALLRGINHQWFTEQNHSVLWNALSRRYNANGEVNLMWVLQYAQEQNIQAEFNRGLDNLTSVQFDSALEIMRRAHGRKQLFSELNTFQGQLFTTEPITLIDKMTTRLNVLRKSISTQNGNIDKKSIKEKIIKEIKYGVQIKTGFPTLDWLIKGIRPNSLVTLGGYTSHGKSLFIQNIAFNVAKEDNHVTVFTTELNPEAYYKRLNVAMTSINPDVYHANEEQLNEFILYLDGTLDLPINIYKEFYLSAIRMKIKQRESVLYIIDHIQPLYPDQQFVRENEKLGYIMEELERLSKEYEVAIWVTSHFNRPPKEERRKMKRPSQYSYYGSGRIEQSTDIGITMLHPYRDADWKEKEEMEKDDKHNIINIDVWKNRLFGLTEMFRVYFNRKSLTLREVSGESNDCPL